MDSQLRERVRAGNEGCALECMHAANAPGLPCCGKAGLDMGTVGSLMRLAGGGWAGRVVDVGSGTSSMWHEIRGREARHGCHGSREGGRGSREAEGQGRQRV